MRERLGAATIATGAIATTMIETTTIATGATHLELSPPQRSGHMLGRHAGET
jgi:hypothetical protein